MSSSLGSPKVVFDPAGSGYHTFRIPAIVGQRDALFAFCEGRRHGSGDAGEIEVVLRRSYDGGTSWDALRVVTAVPGKTCGNPTPVVDPASGDLVLLTQQNAADTAEDAVQRGMADPEAGRRVFVQRSADGGSTWTAPDEITAAVKPAGWAWYATGPCHAIALEHGPHAGRLVAPANHSAVSCEADPSRRNGGHCLLSDDGGHSWRLGFVDRNDGTEINANETTVAELPDGRLYFNSRNHRGTSTARVGAWSSDGGASLDAPYAGIPEITAPGIQGSLLALPGGRLLLTTPVHPSIRRELTVFASDDAGRTWTPGLVPHEGMAGYSDLVPLPGGGPSGAVGVLYEAGETSSFATLRFTTFDPATV